MKFFTKYIQEEEFKEYLKILHKIQDNLHNKI